MYSLQALSVRDFDDHATRMVGKYEVHVAPDIKFILYHLFSGSLCLLSKILLFL